eukprot:432988_1
MNCFRKAKRRTIQYTKKLKAKLTQILNANIQPKNKQIGRSRCKYKAGKRDKQKTARRFCKSHKQSMQGINKIIRAALCKDLYYDIDMKNAHPTILYHLCRMKGIHTPELKRYIDDRDD